MNAIPPAATTAVNPRDFQVNGPFLFSGFGFGILLQLARGTIRGTRGANRVRDEDRITSRKNFDIMSFRGYDSIAGNKYEFLLGIEFGILFQVRNFYI